MTGSGPDVRPPRQERSRRTMDRILDAAEELLAERPFDEIAVDEIVERAGYTKGAFYHRFEDKAALLRHLDGRLFESALAGWEDFLAPERWEGAPLSEVAEALVRRLGRIYRERGPLMRSFVYEARWGGNESVRERARELNGVVRERLLALVEERRGELRAERRDRPGEAVDFWLAAVVGVLGQLLLLPDGGLSPPDLGAGEVEDHAVELLVPWLAAAG